MTEPRKGLPVGSKLLFAAVGRRARVAVFLSGGGSNARVLLAEHRKQGDSSPIDPVCLVTDKPDDPSCGVRAIAEEFDLPVVGCDIRAFYRERGHPRVTVRTTEGKRLREEWTEELRARLAPLTVDLGVLAGFEILSNITGDYPCLNVHPGDLTYLQDGVRYLVGLHTVPIERAILAGLTTLRSSVIVATPYQGGEEDMDSGPLLGLSPAVSVDLDGQDLDHLRSLAGGRPAVRPVGGFGDALERVAALNQERLKEGGDWVVFPQVVFHAARGRFLIGGGNEVYFRESDDGAFRRVVRLEFGQDAVRGDYA